MYKKLIILLSAVLFGVGVYFIALPYIGIGSINTDKEKDGTTLLCGNIELIETAYDDELGISCDSAILIRTVETVQYVQNENGEVQLVISNQELPSFEKDGIIYDNSFASVLSSKIFYGKASIGGIEIDESILQKLAYDSYSDFSAEIIKKEITDLPEDNGNIYGLVKINNTYVTASDDYEAGDIIVSYKEVDMDSLPSFTVVGDKEGNSMSFDEEGIELITDSELSVSDVRKMYDHTSMYGYVLVGIGLVLISTVLFKKNKSDQL